MPDPPSLNSLGLIYPQPAANVFAVLPVGVGYPTLTHDTTYDVAIPCDGSKTRFPKHRLLRSAEDLRRSHSQVAPLIWRWKRDCRFFARLCSGSFVRVGSLDLRRVQHSLIKDSVARQDGARTIPRPGESFCASFPHRFLSLFVAGS